MVVPRIENGGVGGTIRYGANDESEGHATVEIPHVMLLCARSVMSARTLNTLVYFNPHE